MKLVRALRLTQTAITAFVGGGGKTSALFLAARESAPALVSTSTHLAARQTQHAERHLVWQPNESAPHLEDIPKGGVTLVTGPYREDIARVTGLTQEQLSWLRNWATAQGVPLFLEADGSRQRPLKAPAAHEPAIPPFADVVVVTAGMKGLGKPLEETFIHRPQIFGALSGLHPGEPVNEDALIQVLKHPDGGLKNIPNHARRVVLLNQADTDDLQARAGKMASRLLEAFDAVVIASVQHGVVYAAQEKVAGIVLAAGQASRYGAPKQLLDFQGEPFVRHTAKTALSAGLSPVVVVTGAYAEQVERALQDLPVQIARNENWQEGQAASVKAGLMQALTQDSDNTSRHEIGAAIFLLADQPQVTVPVLVALKERHAEGLFPVVAPLIAGRRGNPVLFDRDTFPALMNLHGDTGGREVMRQFPVEYLTWHDEHLLLDVDNEDDYRNLTRNRETVERNA